MSNIDIKKSVREGYAVIATGEQSSCCGGGCGSADADNIASKVGYSQEQLATLPEGANMGLSCGNPFQFAELKAGETVLDLGSGGGIDCFIASKEVGPQGRVIGVDMTPEMIEKARRNKENGNYTNVEFRLGELENLPVADKSVDLVISNCVINLVPDKARVFAEIHRVLVPGGRFVISDMVSRVSIPDYIADSIRAHVGCLGAQKDKYLEIIARAGFESILLFESSSLDFDVLGPTVQGILKETGATENNLREWVESIESIKVGGSKSSDSSCSCGGSCGCH